jgi:hypothetical protein
MFKKSGMLSSSSDYVKKIETGVHDAGPTASPTCRDTGGTGLTNYFL